MYTLSKNFDTLIVAIYIGKGFHWLTAAKTNIHRDIKTKILFQLQNLGRKVKAWNDFILSFIHDTAYFKR